MDLLLINAYLNYVIIVNINSLTDGAYIIYC